MSDLIDAWWGGPPQSDEERWTECPKHQYAASEVQAFRWGCQMGECRHCGKPKSARLPRSAKRT